MCIAFHTQFLIILHSVWTQRILGILAFWGSSDNLGILKNKGRRKSASFRTLRVLTACWRDVASLKTACVCSGAILSYAGEERPWFIKVSNKVTTN